MRFYPQYTEAEINDANTFLNPYVPRDVVIKQNIWSFGQVIALGLLVLPLVSFFGQFLCLSVVEASTLTYSPGAFHSIRRDNVTSSEPLTSASPVSFNQSLSPGIGGSQSRSFTVLQPTSHRNVISCHQTILRWLWYLLSVKTGVFFLMGFATGSAPWDLQDSSGVLYGIQFVTVPAAVDIGILWLFTGIFLDNHIQSAWSTRMHDIFLFKPPFPFIGGVVSITVVVAASVIWELWYNYDFPGESFKQFFRQYVSSYF